MTEKKHSGNPAWVKGKSANPNGSPAKRRRQRKSELRKLGAKLAELEPKSLENLERSINGEEVNKLVLESSKWCLNSIVNISKAASQEEMTWMRIQQSMIAMDKLDSDDDEEPTQSVESIEQEAPKRLSLVYVNPDNDEE